MAERLQAAGLGSPTVPVLKQGPNIILIKTAV
jgi:hypothetical protein